MVMGLDVLLGFDFMRHAKPLWDFLTDEVQFRCPRMRLSTHVTILVAAARSALKIPGEYNLTR